MNILTSELIAIYHDEKLFITDRSKLAANMHWFVDPSIVINLVSNKTEQILEFYFESIILKISKKTQKEEIDYILYRSRPYSILPGWELKIWNR